MKKITTLLALLLVAVSTLSAQVLINEDFENSSFPPSGWISLDEDSLTSSSSVFTGSWERLSLTSNGTFQAASGSQYLTTGSSDDWLITPSITIPNDSAKTTVISFIYASLLSGVTNFGDLEVKVSTDSTNIADFITNFPIDSNTLANTFQRRIVNLSQFGGDTINVAFRNISSNTVGITIDDILIENIADNAISLDSILVKDIEPKQAGLEISGYIRNEGATSISSADVSWSVDGGPASSVTITGLDIAPYSTGKFIHPDQFTGSNAGSYHTLDVTVSNPNGTIDPDTTDNSLTKNVFISYGITVPRSVLLEQFTTIGGGFDPDGQLFVDRVLDSIPNLIPINAHACFSPDVMTITEASDLCSTIGNASVPSAMVDRKLFEGENAVAFGRDSLPGANESAWLERSRNQNDNKASAKLFIGGSYDNSSRVVDVNIASSFVDYIEDGDIRLSLIIVEDSVTGGSQYNQRNFYNTIPGHPFQGKGDPLVGYVHKNVLRDILPSTWGDSTVIPSNNRILNNNYSKNFNFTLNNQWDENQVSLVAVLSYFGGANKNKYEVLNAKKVLLNDLDSLASFSSCQASFSKIKDTSTAFGVVLVNTSTNVNTHSYSWDFGDSSTASTRNPSHNYQRFGSYEVCLTVSDTVLNCTSTYCDSLGMDSLGNLKTGFSLTVVNQSQLTVGVENSNAPNEKNNELEFNIYPNPAKDQVNIDFRDINETVNIKIIDLAGRKILEKNSFIPGNIETVDVSSFNSGLYFVIVNNGLSQKAKRLIIGK